MEGLLILLLIAGGAAWIAHLLRRRRTRDKPDSPSAVQADLAVPKIKVVTLGLQGTGKTVLLTSMYRRLQTPQTRGYYIRAPRAQLNELNRWYDEVANADMDWPRGTSRGQMREFEFNVITHQLDQPQAVLTLSYLEYPGELLTDRVAPGDTSQEQLTEAIETADALIGILDGLRILEAKAGDMRAFGLLLTSLNTMVDAMISARCPIAFVITKWDLLDGLHPNEDQRLQIVRDMLLGDNTFRDLVRVHGSQRVIRLIPVTAVGHDFAVLDDGEIKKRPDGQFEPADVELPLAAVVPDILSQIELSLDQEARSAVTHEASRRARLTPGQAVESLAMFVAQGAGALLAGALGNQAVATGLLGLFLDSRFESTSQPVVTMTDSGPDRSTTARRHAQRRVVTEMHMQVARLEGRLPSSRLGG